MGYTSISGKVRNMCRALAIHETILKTTRCANFPNQYGKCRLSIYEGYIYRESVPVSRGEGMLMNRLTIR